MQINFVYDPSVSNAPSGFTTALAAAASVVDSLIINPITVTIQVGWQEDHGRTFTGNEIGLGGPSNGVILKYSQIRNDLSQSATSGADLTAIASLPGSDPTGGGNYYVSSAQEKALGLIPPSGGPIDGSVAFGGSSAFNFDPNNRAVAGKIDFVGVAEHELTHALGRIAGLQQDGPNEYTPMDLFRYAGPGTRQLTVNSPAYFSIDGGQTNLDNYDTFLDASDWASSLGDAFNAAAQIGVANVITLADITQMDVIGFTISGFPLPLTIAGTRANQTTTDQTSIAPFSTVRISDQNGDQTETVTINFTPPVNGILTNLGGGSYDAATGMYTISGSLATVNAAVDGLLFVPTSQQAAPGSSMTTSFTLKVTDAGGRTATDSTTTVNVSTSAFSGVCTVMGAIGFTASIPMDTRANVTLLQPLLTSISNGVTAGTVLSGSPGSAPPIPSGKSGLLLIATSGQVVMPAGYTAAVVDVPVAVTIAGGSSSGQLIAAGQSGLTFNAGSGAGSVFAGGGNNRVNIDSVGGSQFIALGNGNDTISVAGGNDTISGGNGTNLIFLGAGTDSVRTTGTDTVVGGSGTANVTVSGANSLVFGSFTSTGGLNAMLGGPRATISAANSATSVTTNSANALVYGSFGAISGGLSELDNGQATTVFAGAFGAAASLNGSSALLYGNFNNNPGTLNIRDGGTVDTISAVNSAMNATLSGSQTLLFGGYGSIAGALNIVDAGHGDTIATGNSNTNITAGTGGNGLLVFGGTGTFNFVGGPGTATVVAGSGASSLTPGSGAITLYGSAGSNIGLAGSNGLLFVAGAGNETLNGGGSSGNNELVGGPGADFIVGGAGNDTLFAGAGPETLGGGGGSDIYSFVSSRTHGSADTILDFAPNDTLYLTGYGANAATTVLNSAFSAGGSTTITLSDHTQITFLNVASAATLQGHVFSF